MNKVMKVIKWITDVGYLIIGIYELFNGTPPLKYILGILLIVLAIANIITDMENKK